MDLKWPQRSLRTWMDWRSLQGLRWVLGLICQAQTWMAAGQVSQQKSVPERQHERADSRQDGAWPGEWKRIVGKGGESAQTTWALFHLPRYLLSESPRAQAWTSTCSVRPSLVTSPRLTASSINTIHTETMPKSTPLAWPPAWTHDQHVQLKSWHPHVDV